MTCLGILCFGLVIVGLIFVFALGRAASRESPEPPAGPIDWDGFKEWK